MITTFPTTHAAAPVMRDLGLDPAFYPGTREVLESLTRLHIEPLRNAVSRDTFNAAIENAREYWHFQMDAARDYAVEFFGPDTLADSVVCSLIGGADIINDARVRPWKTPAARDSWRIVRGGLGSTSAKDLYYADMDVRFFVMMDTYYDLCVARSRLEGDPDVFRGQKLADLKLIGVAETLEFPNCTLTRNIHLTEENLRELWDTTYPQPPARTKPQALRLQ